MKKSNEEIEKKKKPNKYWDFETCKEEALKYSSKSEFIKNCNGAYNKAWSNDWLGDICSHMIPLGNKYYRLVYVYEFSDNHAYIGLTGNTNKRFSDHKKGGSVYKHKEKTGLIPNNFIISDYIDYGDAQELEHATKLKYIKDGWFILNKGATGRGVGSIGGISIKWTYEACKEVALKYNTRGEFLKYNGSAYASSRKNGWLDEICSHMVWCRVYINHWTFEKCKEQALKSGSKKEFRKSGAYNVSKRNGWLDEICSIFPKYVVVKKWNFDKCKEEVLKYNTKSEFKNSNGVCYRTCIKNGWLDDICSHMIEGYKPKGYWTFETCKEVALKYNTFNEFNKENRCVYTISLKNGWLYEICSHMEYIKKPNNYWSKNICKEEALKYDNRNEFRKYSITAYNKSIKNGWLDDIFPKIS